MKIAFINTYGQSGLSNQKLLELENFIEYNRLDIVCLQETDVQEETFSQCNILDRFQPIINNNKSGYGTCTLVRNIYNPENIIKDTEGRLISVDVEGMTVVNVYLHSGTDHDSKNEREEYISNIPNLLLYKKMNGFFGGDMNSIVEKKDSMNYPEQKMSKCLSKLINIYKMRDSYRLLYPHTKQFSRYYVWKGKEGATRIDRCYSWGEVIVQEAEYLVVSFSDHLAHVVTFDTPTIRKQNVTKKKSIYKIKHHIVDDDTFLFNVRSKFPEWLLLKDGLSPSFWWEHVVKSGIKEQAFIREKEINKCRRRQIAALQLRLSYHLRNLKKCLPDQFTISVLKLENVKAEMQSFYQKRAKIILLQNRAEIFDMSDATKLYHYESLDSYVLKSEIKKIEVNGHVYEGQTEVEYAINRSLEGSMSEIFTLDRDACENLFSFPVPQITESMDSALNSDISMMELKNALMQLNSKASPGIDGIPSTLYSKMVDLFAPHMLEVFNFILHGEKPTETMRTSTVQFLNKPKKAGSLKLSDKRKISVLCTDFKCLETVLANRLNAVMPQFISESQYASKPKKIHQGISAARDLASFAERQKIDMAILALDMKSGFDFLQMDFVYFCFQKYGFSDKTIDIFKNVYGNALALSVVNGQRSKLIQDLRETLRQGGSGSMQIFNIGVNPLIQLLERSLQGVTLYSLPQYGPVQEHEEILDPVTKTTSIIGYVDDLNPVITKVEEFDTCNSHLILFEKASGCKFHRDPMSQKCKVTPFGSWKDWLTQNAVPLPFLLVSDQLEILGVKIFESWSKTRRAAGEELKSKIKSVRDKWRRGRFYDLLLRPHVVNTYLFSNIWHKAGSINLLCNDLDKMQSEGNDYIFADCYLRPEKVVNYLERNAGGLGINHVRSKASALFIKNILEDTHTNLYLDAVVRKYCKSEDIYPVPVKPSYMDARLISKIKLVLSKNSEKLSTRNIYQVLMRDEFHITTDFKLRIESLYDDFSLQSSFQFTLSKVIPVSVRSHMWKLIHRIRYSEIEEAKIKLTITTCKICGEVDVDRIHLYFKCEKMKSIGDIFTRVLRVFDPQYSLEEVIEFKAMDEHPQLFWFIALTMYYIDENRKKVNCELYKAFMWSEFETLKMTKYADDEILMSINILLELLEH